MKEILTLEVREALEKELKIMKRKRSLLWFLVLFVMCLGAICLSFMFVLIFISDNNYIKENGKLFTYSYISLISVFAIVSILIFLYWMAKFAVVKLTIYDEMIEKTSKVINEEKLIIIKTKNKVFLLGQIILSFLVVNLFAAPITYKFYEHRKLRAFTKEEDLFFYSNIKPK